MVIMACEDVRITESLRVKIGEAKNLCATSSGLKSTYCTLNLDREEIFKSSVIERSTNPFYGAEFSGEIPRQFRYLSCYIHEKPDKVIGKVSIRKKDLHKYHNKDHWFPILPVGASNEVQGKVHLEWRFEEYLASDEDYGVTHRLAVRVVECNDLPVTNGACNPYAVVTLSYGKVKNREEVKRTNVKKKTICPQFDETFFFDLESKVHLTPPLKSYQKRAINPFRIISKVEMAFATSIKPEQPASNSQSVQLENKGQNHERNLYTIDDIFSGELRVSLWHTDSQVTREVLGGMFPGLHLGEVKLPLSELSQSSSHNSWYFLRPLQSLRPPTEDLGSLRLKISYCTEHVFSSFHYEDLRNLLLESSEIKPISSSAAYILGQISDSLEDASQPLLKVFLHHGKIVPFIQSLAEYEIERTSDHNTLFRGNTLLTKMVDCLMKLVGLPYLSHNLKPTIDQICTERLPCEIDPSRLHVGENINANLDNLRTYVEQVFEAITNSGLLCPRVMTDIFCTLKKAACEHFSEKTEVRYQVVSGFVFLRFFAPAILGPQFFDLTTNVQDSCTSRTLTLISKTIQGLGNLVSSKSWSFSLKEDYMVPLFEKLSDSVHTSAVKMFLDIISSSSDNSTSDDSSFDMPIVLKQGTLIKRAQGRRRFGMKNFKQRHFCLTTKSLTYGKVAGAIPLCKIPVGDIRAVERLAEQSFKMKYMFQIIQPSRALYVQASNCIEEKEWLDVLTKVCCGNSQRLNLYHPAAFLNGHWLCCNEAVQSSSGCTPVSGPQPPTDVTIDIDTDRQMEKIHAILFSNMEKMEAMQDACGALEVYTGGKFCVPMEIEDSKSCFEMINEILRCVIGLEQAHIQYRKHAQKEHVQGSFESPIGDDSVLSQMSEGGTKL